MSGGAGAIVRDGNELGRFTAIPGYYYLGDSDSQTYYSAGPILQNVIRKVYEKYPDWKLLSEPTFRDGDYIDDNIDGYDVRVFTKNTKKRGQVNIRIQGRYMVVLKIPAINI